MMDLCLIFQSNIIEMKFLQLLAWLAEVAQAWGIELLYSAFYERS